MPLYVEHGLNTSFNFKTMFLFDSNFYLHKVFALNYWHFLLTFNKIYLIVVYTRELLIPVCVEFGLAEHFFLLGCGVICF